MPQVDVLAAVTIGLLFSAGLKWEAVVAVFAACGIAVGALVKLVVFRPRPSADLVKVFSQLPSSGFPSGHVLEFTAFCGFLTFLAYTLLKPSWGRTAALVFLGLLILLMGLSRIYQGQHWFSDVMGAYLLGSLWLVLTIRLYRWGKPRFFAHQPVAPETPAVTVAHVAPAA
jgi:undecaprenyl-diphosphatase